MACFWTDLVGVSQVCEDEEPVGGFTWVLDETWNMTDAHISPFFYTADQYPWGYLLAFEMEVEGPDTMTLNSLNAAGAASATSLTVETDNWTFGNELFCVCYHWQTGQLYLGGRANDGVNSQDFVSAWSTGGDFNSGFVVDYTTAPFMPPVVTRLFGGAGSSGDLIIYGPFDSIDSVSQRQLGSVDASDGDRTATLVSPSAFGSMTSVDNAIDMYANGAFVGINSDVLSYYDATGVLTSTFSLTYLSADDFFPIFSGVSVCIHGDGLLIAGPASGDDNGVTVLRLHSDGSLDTDYTPLFVANTTGEAARRGPPSMQVTSTGELLITTGLYKPIRRYTLEE